MLLASIKKTNPLTKVATTVTDDKMGTPSVAG